MNPSSYYRANENLRFKLTTPEEEKSLFVRAKAGDSEAREFLIRNHLLFAATYARRQNRGKLPEDEVISAVNAALMNAIDRFDPERGNRFTRYLIPFLRGALASLWKEKNTVEPLSHSTTFPEFTHYTESEGGEHRNTGQEMPSKVRRQIAEMAPSTDEIVVESEELSLNLAMLSQCRAKLTSEEKELLRRMYEEKESMADIARERGVSRQAVQATHKQIVEKLREAFRKGGRK